MPAAKAKRQELTCVRCGRKFRNVKFKAYCKGCVLSFHRQSAAVCRTQHPAPGVFLDGSFRKEKSFPQSVEHKGKLVCGLCGSDKVSPGYGLGSGGGLGTYTFCEGCNSFLDFREDRS